MTLETSSGSLLAVCVQIHHPKLLVNRTELFTLILETVISMKAAVRPLTHSPVCDDHTFFLMHAAEARQKLPRKVVFPLPDAGRVLASHCSDINHALELVQAAKPPSSLTLCVEH